jgi:adenylosuccinate synthase
MVNGFTDLNLTKVDVFTGYDTIKIGLAYRDGKSGKIVENKMPASLKVCLFYYLGL